MNRIINYFKISFLLFLPFFLLSCNNDSNKESSDNNILTIYTFELNLSLVAGSESGLYHKVCEYNCTSMGDSYYDVISYKVHFLSDKNNAYKNKTGNQLISLVRSGNLTPSRTEKSIRTSISSDKGFVNSDTNEESIFYLPTKAKFETLWYF